MSAIVNTFIVGMPKAGTTSLHRYLAAHPDTCMALDKEPHFFSVDLLNEGAEFHGHPKYTRYPTLESYHELFSKRGDASVVGESSVFYLFSKQAATEIARYNPDAKIIIMLREPVAFLYSLHSQGLYSGNETEADFEKALSLEDSRRQGMNIPSTVHFPSRLFYSEHVQLREQIERYLQHFPREQVKIIVFDDFKANTETVVRDVMDFLGIDSTQMPDLVNHNQNTAMRSQRLARLIQDPNHPITRVSKKMLPKRVWKQGKVLLKKINTDHSPRSTLDEALKKRLRTQVAPHVRDLDAYLVQSGALNQEGDLLRLWSYGSD